MTFECIARMLLIQEMTCVDDFLGCRSGKKENSAHQPTTADASLFHHRKTTSPPIEQSSTKGTQHC
jgi:hypothetical protein